MKSNIFICALMYCRFLKKILCISPMSDLKRINKINKDEKKLALMQL